MSMNSLLSLGKSTVWVDAEECGMGEAVNDGIGNWDRGGWAVVVGGAGVDGVGVDSDAAVTIMPRL
jgi:hypothetical protein